MEFFIIQALNGLVFGMLLFLLAAGFTLILGLMDIVNLAHGSFYLFGGYIGYSITKHTHSLLLGCLGGILVTGLLGIVSYRAILQQRFARDVLAQVLITFGILLIFTDVCRWIWGGVPLIIPKPGILEGAVNLGIIVYPKYRLSVIVIGALVFGFLWWFQEKTKYGAIIRAGVDDEKMTEAVGINISVVKMLVFGLGIMLAGVAGVIGAPLLGLFPGLDMEILLLAFVVIIIGGMGSLWGALVGAIFIGLLDSFGKSLVPELSVFTIFAAMVVVLAIKPSGFFGSE
jgi:branched-chain amino acid transport system permease protein